MIRGYLFSILFFLSTISFAQVRVYEDLKGNIVSKEEFLHLRTKVSNLYAYRASNDTVFTFLYKGTRDFKGQLSESDLLRLKELYPFKEDNLPIVIQYFPGIDDCSAHYISRTDEMITFLREKNSKIAKGNKAVYYIYKSNDKVERISEKFKWKKDVDGFIESLFFEYHFPCGSYVVVNKDGKFRGYKGEYGVSQIIDNYNKLK